MLMVLLKTLQHFIKNRFSHFVLSFFSFFKEIVIFVLHFFMLKALAIKFNLLFVAKMCRSFLVDLLFSVFGYTEAVRINSIVVFSIIVYLRFKNFTLFMFYIWSESIKDILRCASAVLRSLLSLSLAWP